MDLRKAGIGEQGATFVSAPDGSGIAAFGVGGKIENVAIAASSQDNGVGHVNFDFAVVETAGDNAPSVAIDDDEVEHVHARVHFHRAKTDLAFEGLVGAKKKLLAGLASGIKGARDLRAAEGTVVEEATILTGERNALRDTLIDDVHANLSEAVNVGFASAEIAALYGVVEEAVNAVAIVVIIFRGVDAALRSNGVSAPRTVLIAEALNVVAEFAEAGGSSATGEAGTNDDDVVLALVGRIDELEIEFVFIPRLFNRPCWGIGL